MEYFFIILLFIILLYVAISFLFAFILGKIGMNERDGSALSIFWPIIPLFLFFYCIEKTVVFGKKKRKG